MQHALILHLPVAFLMFSNTKIFSDTQSGVNLSSVLSSTGSDAFFSSDRVQAVHSQLYLAMGFIIFVFYVLINLIVIVYQELAKDLPCLKKLKQAHDEIVSNVDMMHHIGHTGPQKPGEPLFSNNIYREMPVIDLKKDYHRTKTEKYQHRTDIAKGIIDKELMGKYVEILDRKQLAIKEVLE